MSESIKKNSPTLLPLTSKVGRDAIKKDRITEKQVNTIREKYSWEDRNFHYHTKG
jgi:hypothetical protein